MGEPENEPSLKGARDSFVESLRTNTSLVRRRLRAPELRVEEHIVGRQSLTPVDVVWLENIADPDTVRRAGERLDEMDIDGVESAGDLEEYLVPAVSSPFPLILSTQRLEFRTLMERIFKKESSPASPIAGTLFNQENGPVQGNLFEEFTPDHTNEEKKSNLESLNSLSYDYQ